MVMFPTTVIGLFVVRRAAELGRPDNQRVVEHASLLQVGHQRSDRSVDVTGQGAVRGHVTVRVPVG